MKNCQNSLRNKIVEYYYNELPAGENAEVEKHLKCCPSCAEEFKLMTGVLEKASKVRRPGLSGSLYFSIKEKLIRSKNNSMKFWNIPLAAGIALLIMLSFVSYSNNMFSIKETDLDETIISAVLKPDSKDANNSNLNTLAADNNMFLIKENELDEAIISAFFELDSKDMNNFDLDMLADEVFLEEDLLAFES